MQCVAGTYDEGGIEDCVCWTVPVQCPYSARTVPDAVPVQCTMCELHKKSLRARPRLEFFNSYMYLYFCCSWRMFSHDVLQKPHRALCGHCIGHCTGTVRALYGHCVTGSIALYARRAANPGLGAHLCNPCVQHVWRCLCQEAVEQERTL